MSFLSSISLGVMRVFAWIVLMVHSISITGHSFVETAKTKHNAKLLPAAMQAAVPDTGYWHTSGNQILDVANRPVRIQGINWYGFETARALPGGLMVQDYRTILQMIKSNGYNTVRIPLSNQMVEMPRQPGSISFENENRHPINEDLRGLNSLEILDRIVAHARVLGLKVILDNHRSEAGDSAQGSGLWYTSTYPESDWIKDWQMLAERYRGNSTVIGVDLRNEPHNARLGGACWDCGGDNDWHLAAMRGGDAVLQVNPRLLIFVEGVDEYNNEWYWWGGNLQGVRRSPVKLAVPHQLVYSPHTYGPNEYRQPWFNANTTPASLEAMWMKQWAYISTSGIAPVWVGEFGTTNKTADLQDNGPGSEGQWFESLVGFFRKNPDLSWTAWALNGEDPDGLLDTNYGAPANPLKQKMIASIMAPAEAPAQGTMVAANAPTRFQRAAFVYGLVEGAGTSALPLPRHESSGCRVSYRSQDDSGRDFTGVIEIENLGDRPIEGWTLLWQYPGQQQISRAANVRLVQSGELVMMSNTSMNGVIPAGSRLSGIAFQSSYRGKNVQPAKFYLNGNLCG